MSEILAEYRQRCQAEREARRATIGYNATSYEAVAPAGDVAAEAPTHSASKADWVDFAVAAGADRDEVEAQTKQSLIDTYGGV